MKIKTSLRSQIQKMAKGMYLFQDRRVFSMQRHVHLLNLQHGCNRAPEKLKKKTIRNRSTIPFLQHIPWYLAKAYPGSILCGVISSVDMKCRLPANGNLLNKRHKIVRDSVRILAYSPTRMCTHRVEVPQQYNFPLWIWSVYIPAYLLNYQLKRLNQFRNSIKNLTENKHERRISHLRSSIWVGCR